MRTISHHPLIWLAALGALAVLAPDASAISLPRAAPRTAGSGWGDALWHALGRFLIHEPGLLWYLLALATIIGLGYFGWSVGEQLADRAKRAPPAPRCAPAARPPPHRLKPARTATRCCARGASRGTSSTGARVGIAGTPRNNTGDPSRTGGERGRGEPETERRARSRPPRRFALRPLRSGVAHGQSPERSGVPRGGGVRRRHGTGRTRAPTHGTRGGVGPGGERGGHRTRSRATGRARSDSGARTGDRARVAGARGALRTERERRSRLRDRGRDRIGRDGRGVRGPPVRLEPHGRAENGAPHRALGLAGRRPVLGRGGSARGGQAPERGRSVPVRRRQRVPVPRDGVRARRYTRRPAPRVRPARTARGRTAGRTTRPRRARRARGRNRPPRHQAGERALGTQRRTQIGRLRIGEARRVRPDADTGAAGNARVPRAGAGDRGAKFVGPAADVWALGVVLYECLTGGRPFVGATTDEVLARVVSAEPAPVSTARVPRDLERIWRACLAKNPADRYQSAADLAADLARFRRGEPIALSEPGWTERALKWARRKPAQAALAVALVTAGALGAFGGTVAVLLHEAVRERKSAESAKSDAVTARADSERDRVAAVAARNDEKTARDRAEGALRAKEIAEKRLAVSEYGNALQVALQHWRDNNVVAARNVLKRTKPELRGWEWHYVNNLCRPDSGTLVLTDHTNGVSAAVWHPDGSRIVTASADHAPKVWDANTGTVAFRLTGHTSWITGAKYSADGSRIVTTSIDNTAKVWDAKGGDALLTLKGHTDSVLAAAFSKDGTRIVTGGNEKVAKVWDAKTGNELLTIKGHANAVLSAAFAPDGARVLTVGRGGTARVWDAKTGQERLTIKSAAHPVLATEWSPDGAHVLTGGADGTARVWSAGTGAEVLALRGHTNAVNSVSYSSDGALVVTGSRDHSAKIWDARTGTERHTLRGHTGSVWSASFSSDRRRVLTGSHDQTARVWDANAGADALALKGHTGAVRSVAFDPEAARVVTGSDDASAKVWDARSGSELLTLKHSQMGAFWAVSFGSDGSYVRTASLSRFGIPGPSRGNEPARSGTRRPDGSARFTEASGWTH